MNQGMNTKSLLVVLAGFALISVPVRAATPEQQKTFVDSYKKALEANDAKTLEGFLYTKGAQPEQIELFKMMLLAVDPGSKVTKIELVKPTDEEAARFNKPMPMPDGKMYKMAVKPTWQLVVSSESKGENGSSSGTSRAPVAEVDGKLVIPVPVPAK